MVLFCFHFAQGMPKVSYGKPKTISAKITGRQERTGVTQSLGVSTGPVGLAPPMSSVMVERHQPVNKVGQMY